ncbi:MULTISPECIES: glutamine synthetase family protein [Mycolicibacter]|uniref:Glutamine synthetase n=2 Tax=Mycolicibacter TaxID=1073531 RepID=A0ABU5XLC0_9MYCO|nr:MULTISPECIES: glutamine synthetase [unclassified Mycolicibacter]MEB3022996.1 glutamine synthetase [Mycolicibacter sp. MYC098]MEB3033506.1 glutamine synthetase [Mycolicibacter sp. MYC340]
MTVETALDRYVHDPERVATVEKVHKMLDELGVTYLYFQVVSVTGRVVGKGVPAAHWRRVAMSGVQMVLGATANVAVSRTGRYLGYGPEASELIAIPDPETFVQLPWDGRAARVFCTLFTDRGDDQDPGAFLDTDCRGNLRHEQERFRAAHGLELRCGIEPEMMWLELDESGRPTGGATNPYCYHIEQFEQLRPVYMQVLDYCDAMGLDVIQGDHEDAPGQLELNVMFDDALRTADRLTTYRQICAQVAREHRLKACFMAKPFPGVSGSGWHHNVSLWAGGEDVTYQPRGGVKGSDDVYRYRVGGDNVFLQEPDSTGPGTVGMQCIAGAVAHLPALTAIAASTVNSYKRLWDTGFWAPIYADWGYQNRTCALRVPAPGRLEYRPADAMVNPYLMMSGLLRAFDDGIGRGLDPGEPEKRSVYSAIESGKVVERLPMNLGDALDALEADPVIRAALRGHLYDVYTDIKRDEWERFLATVTEWDVETYMDFVP